MSTERNADDNGDNDVDDDFPSSGYSMDEFPSLTSIAMYCFAIHSIPRVALYALTNEKKSSSSKNAWAVLGRNLGKAASGKAFFGGLCGLGTFGLGCWQLQTLLDEWSTADYRYEQLQLPPLRYGQQQHQHQHQPREAPRLDVNVGDNNNNNDPDIDSLQQQFQQQRYRRYWVKGRFIHDKEVLIGPRSAPPDLQHSPKSGSQGFCVLTPLELAFPEQAAGLPTTSKVVWINRGWIPKSLLPKWTDRPHYYQHNPIETARIDRLLRERPPAWNRPEGIVEVKAVLSQAEQPVMFITPKHDFLTKPLQMFWIDGRTLKTIAGTDLYTLEELASDTDVALVTQVADERSNSGTTHHDENHNNANNNRESKNQSEGLFLYPLLPPVSLNTANAETIHPTTQMGYAASWFGLSGASWYLTRKLLTKGRF